MHEALAARTLHKVEYIIPMKPFVSLVCLFNLLQHLTSTKYSCDVFRRKLYTAEYGGKCYTRSAAFVAWEQSREICADSGGQLARLHDSEQYKFLLDERNYIFQNKRLDSFMIVWIDAKIINGKLYWTNGQLSTFSKPLPNTENYAKTQCIMVSKIMWETTECEAYSTYVLCEHDKQKTPIETTAVVATLPYTASTEVTTSFAAPTTIAADLTSTASIVSPTPSELQREMTFVDMKLFRGDLHLRLRFEADSTVPAMSFADCAGRCMDEQICELLNFNENTGQCRIYLNAGAALSGGAKSVRGWKLYKRY